MPVLSSIARVAKDYRAAKAGVAILTGASALSPLAANAQQVASASKGEQVAALERNCDVVKAVFDEVKLKGPFKAKVEAWVAGGCRGDVPLPERGDIHNIKEYNTASFILSQGGGIVLRP